MYLYHPPRIVQKYTFQNHMPSRTLIANLYHSNFGFLRSFLEARTRCRETAVELPPQIPH